MPLPAPPSSSVARRHPCRRPRALQPSLHLQAQADRQAAEGSGGFCPRWPVECHFSREYLQDLVAEVDAELAAPAAPASGALQAAALLARRGNKSSAQKRAARGRGDESAAAAGHTALLTPELHAAYAAAGPEKRAQLASQADAMLAAGRTQDAGGANGSCGSSAAPALTAELPPGVLRSHWLLRMQLEWEAAQAEPFSLDLLAQRRRQRRWAGRGGVGAPAWSARVLPSVLRRRH